jgi:glutamine---fructose-6-phosphate transaminase (isomerizing)
VLRHDLAAQTHMGREIAQQPLVLEALVRRRSSTVQLVRAVLPDQLRGTILVGRGSSDIAGQYGGFVLGLVTDRPVVRAEPSLWTRYGASTDLCGWLAVAISQSGQTPEIETALHAMRRRGAATVAVTNEKESPLAAASDAVIELDAGPEVAIPATKTFLCSLLATTHVAAAIAEVPWQEDVERKLVRAVQQMVDDPGHIRALASGTTCTETVHIGCGLTHSIAVEAALKVQETSLVPARGYDVGDLLHGPIATLSPRTLAIGYSVAGPTASDVLDALRAARSRGCGTLLVSQTANPAWQDPLVPAHSPLPEPLAAIAVAVRAQQFALYFALGRGKNPDTPAGLSKVTTTR